MKTPRFWIPTVVLALMLAPAALHAQPPPGTAFTYQGQLKEAGVPGEGTYDFIFQLWDAAEGGAPVSGGLFADDRLVGAGLFTVQLNFGEGMFTGDERWLQVHVRPGDSSGSYTELSPRQPLTAAPYALYALSGPGSGGFWAANADDIYNTNTGDVGIGTASPGYPLHVEGDGTSIAYVRNSGASGRALYASSNGTGVYAAGGGCGLDAYTDSGYAVYAFNEAESGNAYAVYGENISPSGIAIYGLTSNSADYAGGVGVYGLADNDGMYSTGIGVYGRSESDHGGAGVYGEATATGGESAYGVHGVSTSSAGVRGENSDSGNYGCLGRDNAGVYGWGAGYDTGVRGVSSSGRGVRGDNQTYGNYGCLGGAQYGVEGYGDTAGGYFEDSSSSGYAYAGYGNRGIWASGSDAGGYFANTVSGNYAALGGDDYGGYFEAGGSLGCGVYAEVNDPGAGLKYAGYFVCDSETGYGVYASVNGDYTNWAFRGEATGPGSDGAWFSTAGENTRAVYGNASASTGQQNANVGGEFCAAGNMGYGVKATATGDVGTGVSASASGEYGVGLEAVGGASGYAAVFKGNVQIQSRDTYETLVELGEGLDYAEGFDVSQARQIVPGTVLIIDPDNPGKLTISNQPYDTRVAGIVAGANGLGSGVRLGASGFDHDVALAGRVYCNVVATDGPIEPGDLLTTSDIPGCAAKVTDHQRAQGAVLGKAMERLEKGEKGRILVLVTLQ